MKIKSKILSCVLAIVMVLSMAPITALASTPTDSWKNHIAASFEGGSGTKTDPYEIANAEQLAKLASDVNGGNQYVNTCFKLTADMDLGAYTWNTIGIYSWQTNGNTENKAFSGYFDGNNKTITNLYVDETKTGSNAGLFGNVSDNAKQCSIMPTIKNLNLTNAKVFATDENMSQSCSALLIAMAMVNEGLRIVVENVNVSGEITNTMNNGGLISGGIIGSGTRMDFKNCSSSVTINGGCDIGGFVGIDGNNTYTNCSSTGSVDAGWVLGGFVGFSSSSTYQDASTGSTYTNCVSKTKVNAYDWNVGSFVGFNEYGKINNCAAYGDVVSTVTSFNPKVGGFAGSNSGIIKNSHFAGTLTTASTGFNAGGFVAFDMAGTTEKCSFDSTKNSTLSAVGQTDTAGTNDISDSDTKTVLSNICVDVLGGHNPSEEWTVDKKATCTEKGSKSHHCTACDTKCDETEIDFSAHDFFGKYTSDANYHWHICADCDATDEKIAHTWNNGVVTKKATTTSTGVKTYTCTVCGRTKTQSIAKLKATAKSQTISTAFTSKNVGISNIGKTVNIGAKAKTKLTYKSSNTKVATVNSKGVITYKGQGTATITITAAKTSSYKSAKKTVNVTVKRKLIKYKTLYDTNYRTGAGLGYQVIDSIQKGKTVYVLEKSEKKATNKKIWVKVKIGSKYYWMQKNLLKKA